MEVCLKNANILHEQCCGKNCIVPMQLEVPVLVENTTKKYANETGEMITLLVHPQERIEYHKSLRTIDRHFLKEIPDNLQKDVRLDCEYCSDRSNPVEKRKKNKKKSDDNEIRTKKVKSDRQRRYYRCEQCKVTLCPGSCFKSLSYTTDMINAYL